LTPVAVSGLSSGVIAISAGGYHTCALTSAGSAECWGRNESGQLGDATSTGPEECEEVFVYRAVVGCSTTPVAVSGLGSGVIAVSAGGEHTCGLTSVGGSECWGRNESGQLGDATSTGPEECNEAMPLTREPTPFACGTTPVAVNGLGPGAAAISAGGSHTCALTAAGGVKCWGNNRDGQLGDGTSTGPEKCSTEAEPCSRTAVRVSGLTRVTCTTNAGTITLSPGLTGTAVYQGVKIKGTLMGCAGEPFTAAKYTASLTTTSKVTCSALSGPGAATFGTTKYTWTPKTKASTGTLGMPLTETSGIALSGELEGGPYSPLTLSGTVSESYTNAAICGVPQGSRGVIKPVTKGTFSGSAVTFE
jgi:hypothetical protein